MKDPGLRGACTSEEMNSKTPPEEVAHIALPLAQRCDVLT
jgi:hypothetical protein